MVHIPPLNTHTPFFQGAWLQHPTDQPGLLQSLGSHWRPSHASFPGCTWDLTEARVLPGAPLPLPLPGGSPKSAPPPPAPVHTRPEPGTIQEAIGSLRGKQADPGEALRGGGLGGPRERVGLPGGTRTAPSQLGCAAPRAWNGPSAHFPAPGARGDRGGPGTRGSGSNFHPRALRADQGRSPACPPLAPAALPGPAQTGPALPAARGPSRGPAPGLGLGIRRALPAGPPQTFSSAFEERAAPALAPLRRPERCPAELGGPGRRGGPRRGAWGRVRPPPD